MERESCRQKEKHLQPALPPHRSLGNKGLSKCINARERGTDRQRGGRDEEREEGESKQVREGVRAMLLVDRYNIKRDRNIFSQSKTQRTRQRQ